ncbi:MAG TPA: response regulator [Pyrinomonadaceae bacterium]|nr:response regulator [Pyrinomonadaceae bacterium]
MLARILIADDYDDNRELMRLMLEGAGYAVRETRNGRECVAAAQAELPDIVLIDLSMPVLDGWGTLRELRADERTRSLRCIAVTAFAAEQDRLRALEAGFDAYLAKPYRSKDLIDVVESLVPRQTPSRDANLASSSHDGTQTPPHN